MLSIFIRRKSQLFELGKWKVRPLGGHPYFELKDWNFDILKLKNDNFIENTNKKILIKWSYCISFEKKMYLVWRFDFVRKLTQIKAPELGCWSLENSWDQNYGIWKWATNVKLTDSYAGWKIKHAWPRDQGKRGTYLKVAGRFKFPNWKNWDLKQQAGDIFLKRWKVSCKTLLYNLSKRVRGMSNEKIS